MNTTQNQEPRLDFRIQWAKTFGTWLVGPTPIAITCDDFLGCPETAIAEETITIKADKFALPEVDPDEFERVFLWFQS
jgi:hypothetical protein